jgi:hypothetical protein
MQQLALYIVPAGPQDEPPYISFKALKKQVPFPASLMDHYGSAQAVMQSLAPLGLYGTGPLVRIHHTQHVELRAAALAAGQLPPGTVPAAAAAAAAGTGSSGGGWVAPAGTPEPVAAEARGWLHWLAQRVPLTDPPQQVSCKLLRQEMQIPEPVKMHFKGSIGFLQSVPGLQQHAGILALQPELHRALLAAAGPARKS